MVSTFLIKENNNIFLNYKNIHAGPDLIGLHVKDKHNFSFFPFFFWWFAQSNHIAQYILQFHHPS